ncbi:MAG: hypothetical protein ACJ74O_13360 [Frankiaceae bacterium]
MADSVTSLGAIGRPAARHGQKFRDSILTNIVTGESKPPAPVTEERSPAMRRTIAATLLAATAALTALTATHAVAAYTLADGSPQGVNCCWSR